MRDCQTICLFFGFANSLTIPHLEFLGLLRTLKIYKGFNTETLKNFIEESKNYSFPVEIIMEKDLITIVPSN
jgi:hypothetical protein